MRTSPRARAPVFAIKTTPANVYGPHSALGTMRAEMGAEADVPEGGAKCVTVNAKPYALFRVGGVVYCIDNRCTHVGGPLCEGELEGPTVTCPWHGSRFDVRTGQVVGPPARSPVRSYPVTVDGGVVWADVP